MEKKIYSAAMYIRVSKNNKESENNSIKNQKDLIKKFIDSYADINLYDIYIDNGYTGSNLVKVR